MKRARPGSPTVAVAYLRVSTEEQKLGPGAQWAAIEAWAATRGVAIPVCFLDRGVSGAAELDARPALVQALQALRERGAGLLLVGKWDRLARDPFVSAVIERAVQSGGARIVSADGVGNGDGPHEQFMKDIVQAMARYERLMIGVRTKAVLGAKKERGERVGSIPLGFCASEDGRFVREDVSEQRAVARIRALRGEGLSMLVIARRLTEEGVPSRSGRPWHPQQVSRVLARCAA